MRIPEATQYQGDLFDRYQIYLACADDGTGKSIIDGQPLKTFDEWLES